MQINCVILLGLLYYGENNIIKIKRQDLEHEAQAILQVESNLLGDEFDYVLSDIGFLKESYGNRLETPLDIEETAKAWVIFSDKRKVYDQIRFLDRAGNEIIRINYQESGAYRVPDSLLQNKADRYYFLNTIGLSPSQIYITQLLKNM